MDWTQLGTGYPSAPSGPLGNAQRAAFDVLAPLLQPLDPKSVRIPVFSWGHETTPTPEEMWRLAGEIAHEVLRTTRRTGDYPQDVPL
jgi:hypothetical protein